MNRLAEARGFFVAYPEQAGHANSAKCWNWFRTADRNAAPGARAIIAGLTEHIMRMAACGPRARVHRGHVGRRGHGRDHGGHLP